MVVSLDSAVPHLASSEPGFVHASESSHHASPFRDVRRRFVCVPRLAWRWRWRWSACALGCCTVVMRGCVQFGWQRLSANESRTSRRWRTSSAHAHTPRRRMQEREGVEGRARAREGGTSMHDAPWGFLPRPALAAACVAWRTVGRFGCPAERERTGRPETARARSFLCAGACMVV